MQAFFLNVIFLCSGVILGILASKVLRYNIIIDSIINSWYWLITRIDKAITGNDGHVSHTRIINLSWCYVTLGLMIIVVLKQIPVQGEVIILMGSGMGIGLGSSIFNKRTEAKVAADQNSTPGDSNVTEN